MLEMVDDLMLNDDKRAKIIEDFAVRAESAGYERGKAEGERSRAEWIAVNEKANEQAEQLLEERNAARLERDELAGKVEALQGELLLAKSSVGHASLEAKAMALESSRDRVWALLARAWRRGDAVSPAPDGGEGKQ